MSAFDFESNLAELKALLAELEQAKAMPKLTRPEDIPILQVPPDSPDLDTAECKCDISDDVIRALYGMRYFMNAGYNESTAMLMTALARFCALGIDAAEEFVCDIYKEVFGEELEYLEVDIFAGVVDHLFLGTPSEKLYPELQMMITYILAKVNM